MSSDMQDLHAFIAVVRAGGFREAARAGHGSASRLSDGVKRLEASLGARLLHRTTRSVSPTEVGARLAERLGPALAEVQASLDVVNGFRDRPAGTLRLNVPANVARVTLRPILREFLGLYPDIRIELTVEDSFVDLLASGCDAGVRYDERLAQDMIALPIGPPTQRMVTAASPAYLDAHGRPEHPRDLLNHACLRVQFSGGAVPPWEFERDGEVVRIDPSGPLMVRNAAAFDVGVEAAIDGLGVVQLFEDWLRPHLDGGVLEPILAAWSQPFRGPYLYFHGREYLPAPLRAFVDFVRASSGRSKIGDNADGL